jgi:hypothetical protein
VTSIRVLGAVEADARIDELSGLLVDAVALGASVNFHCWAFTGA